MEIWVAILSIVCHVSEGCLVDELLLAKVLQALVAGRWHGRRSDGELARKVMGGQLSALLLARILVGLGDLVGDFNHYFFLILPEVTSRGIIPLVVGIRKFFGRTR